MTTNTYDQSAYMAGRSQQYAQTGPAPQPHTFCLPAAKIAISDADLEVCNAANKSEHEVTTALNQVWKQNNAERIGAVDYWVSQDYLPALKRLREARITAHRESEERLLAQARALEEQAAVDQAVGDDDA